MGMIEKATEELSQFLDTFYSDVEGWLELADIYSSCNQYVPLILVTSQTLTNAHWQDTHTLCNPYLMPFFLRRKIHFTPSKQQKQPTPQEM